MNHNPPNKKQAEALADRIAKLVERSNKLWAESLDRSLGEGGALKPDPLNTLPVMSKLTYEYWNHPERTATAIAQYWAEQADLWTRITKQALGGKTEPLIRPDKSDKRFRDECWDENPAFDYLKQSYLLTARWLHNRLDDVETLDPQERRKLALITRNMIEAMSPSNNPATNPEVIRTTVAEDGENLLRGLENLTRDLERGHGQLLIRQTDLDAFAVGENIAVTPGSVIFQNDIFQLIQYTPTTQSVHETPLLFIPPWINKFYILDLNEKKSMIQWLCGQGHSVFVISWVNPDERHRNETWESYMQKGVLCAIDQVLAETGVGKLNLVGYCIGGTMCATTLAYMAHKDDTRVASATFFTAQTDFTDAGELQAFVDDEVLDTVEKTVSGNGYLAAENMAGAFNSLRSTDLIWSFVINNYLMGKDNFPFDLLYWNSDSTRMPGRVHLFYLDGFYNRNLLARGEMSLGGQRLDLGSIRVPSYHVATVEDHIAPAPSAYRGAKMLGGRSKTFVLAGSGHIAGVINPPPAKKYQYWTRQGVAPDTLDDWRKNAQETPGSWWPHWDAWLARHSRKQVPARTPGAVLGVIEPAPGSYVRVRSDTR